jgi:hypothetical protein
MSHHPGAGAAEETAVVMLLEEKPEDDSGGPSLADALRSFPHHLDVYSPRSPDSTAQPATDAGAAPDSPEAALVELAELLRSLSVGLTQVEAGARSLLLSPTYGFPAEDRYATAFALRNEYQDWRREQGFEPTPEQAEAFYRRERDAEALPQLFAPWMF